jgi:hypothetical protein
MEDDFATLIQRLEAFQVALLEAALAAADLEELLTEAAETAEVAPEAAPEAAPEVAPEPTEPEAAWKVDGTRVQTAPGEPWINVYDAIKSVLAPDQTLEVPTDAESSTTDRV